MAPVPTIQKKKQQTQIFVPTTTGEVVDDLGVPLDYTLRKQKRTNRDHDSRITTNRQHSQQYESKMTDNKLIYRDVFPGRKYKLTLSDTTWMGDSNVCTIGYTVGDTFTQLSSTAEAPEDNVFDVEIPVVQAIDSLEVRMIGASDTVRGYLEDTTSASGILNKIAQILDDIIGLGGRIDALEAAVGIPYTGTDSLDDRVSALEQEITPSNS